MQREACNAMYMWYVCNVNAKCNVLHNVNTMYVYVVCHV